MVETLWNVFLVLGLIFLIMIVVFGIVNFLYNITIGNKIKKQEKEKALEELEKSTNDVVKGFGELIEFLANLDNEETQEEKPTKKTKKTTKKESE